RNKASGEMSVNWKELVGQKPHELVFSGKSAAKQIEEENGLSEIIFDISTLNFLEISKTNITEISSSIGRLNNLTNLVLSGNKLQTIPANIGKLTKLKLLDVSNNELNALPNIIGDLIELQSLVVSMNQLSSFPSSISNLLNLHIIKFSQNKFDKFPESLCSENLKMHLAEIHASHNQIDNIPSNIDFLAALKLLDLNNNCVKIVPRELADCTRLKDLNLKGNKLSDRRLMKLVEQGKQKQILDYIKAHCPKTKMSENTTDNKTKTKDKEKQSDDNEKETCQEVIKVLGVKGEERRIVEATAIALEMRKIVCCIVRNVNLEGENILKKFIQLQTSLHDTICTKRQSATIASHDLSKVNGKVIFDLKPPNKIKLTPLGRSKEMTAAELYKTLNEEADLYRKEKKRTTYSGIHKYLYLLKGKQRYPCLVDEQGTVISFPPLTNSNVTKISKETKDLFLEVTGESVPKCREVMDALLHGMAKMQLASLTTNGGDCSNTAFHILEVEPVKIVDIEGKLYNVYPSKVDLNFTDINVIRESQ
ncbi:leucine-rich repeat-containing protein 47-like protein, partial [Dinothrombium tinctorium]